MTKTSTKATSTKTFIIHDLDVNKVLVSTKESYGTKIHLNTSSDIMVIMSLDHYV